MIMGQLTTFNEDVKAYYYEPLREQDFINNIKESNYMITPEKLKENMLKRMNKEYEQKNPLTENTQYYSSVGIPFFGRDGTSDAYVKRGVDSDIAEYFDRQQLAKRSRRFQTSNSSIDFKSGGKIVIGSKEWIIAKIINIQSGSDFDNKVKGTYNMDLLENFGNKIFILI